MNKQEFLAELRARLSDPPRTDTEERLTFYSEMIDDRMEEGLSEEDAVAAIGSVDEIADQIRSENQSADQAYQIGAEAVQTASPQTGISAGRIALIILTFPLWTTAYCFILTGILLIWSVIFLVPWSMFVGFSGAAIGTVPAAVLYLFESYPIAALYVAGSGLLSAGLAVFTFFLSIKATKLCVYLTKKLFRFSIELWRFMEGKK